MEPRCLSPNAARASLSPARADNALVPLLQWQAAGADMERDQGRLLLSFLQLLSQAEQGEGIQNAAKAFAPVVEATCLVDVITRRRVHHGARLLQRAARPADVQAHTELVQDARKLQLVLREYAGSLAEDAGAHRRPDPD